LKYQTRCDEQAAQQSIAAQPTADDILDLRSRISFPDTHNAERNESCSDKTKSSDWKTQMGKGRMAKKIRKILSEARTVCNKQASSEQISRSARHIARTLD